MKFSFSNLAVAVLFLGSTAAHAEPTLKQLLDSAEKQNVDRRISREQLNRAEAEYAQAWSSLLPAFSAGATWTDNQYATVINLPNTPPRTITPIYQKDGQLRVDLPLIDASRWFRSASNSAAADAAASRDVLMKDQVRRELIGTYYNYAAALALRESAKRSKAAADESLRLQIIRQQVGTATELELLRSKAEVERNRQTLADTELLVATAHRSLHTVAGMEPGLSATLPKDDLQPEPGFVELEGKVNDLPRVMAAEKDALAASRATTAQELAFIPTISANFVERFTNAAGLLGQGNYYVWGVGLNWRIDVPMFEAVRIQKANESISRLTLEKTQLFSKDQIHSDWQHLTASIEKVTAAQAQTEAAKRAAEVAIDRYGVGAATQIEVIQAERDLFSAEVGQIQARTELAFARFSLRISAGLPLGIE